jgi:F-type H+-transporting ATPase subunit b
MKRVALAVMLLFTVLTILSAQEPVGAQPEHPPAAAEHGEATDSQAMWKWANFAILAAVLGWMIAKKAPPFFRSRTEEIQRGIAEATRLRQDAEARAAKMEMRMAALASEIEHLRADARMEMAKEAARIRKEAEHQIGRIQAHSEQEIRAAAKHAEQSLRTQAAELSIQLAAQRIGARMTPDAQKTLFDAFLSQLPYKDGPAEVRR